MCGRVFFIPQQWCSWQLPTAVMQILTSFAAVDSQGGPKCGPNTASDMLAHSLFGLPRHPSTCAGFVLYAHAGIGASKKLCTDSDPSLFCLHCTHGIFDCALSRCRYCRPSSTRLVVFARDFAISIPAIATDIHVPAPIFNK